MKIEEWHPSHAGDQLTGHYGRQGGDAFVQTDAGLLLGVPQGAEAALKAIDPDVGQRVTLQYAGTDLHGNPVYQVLGEG